jgi:hypothetical protein
MDVPDVLSRVCPRRSGFYSRVAKREGPPERAFQCSLAKRATVSLPLLADLLGAASAVGAHVFLKADESLSGPIACVVLQRRMRERSRISHLWSAADIGFTHHKGQRDTP